MCGLLDVRCYSEVSICLTQLKWIHHRFPKLKSLLFWTLLYWMANFRKFCHHIRRVIYRWPWQAFLTPKALPPHLLNQVNKNASCPVRYLKRVSLSSSSLSSTTFGVAASLISPLSSWHLSQLLFSMLRCCPFLDHFSSACLCPIPLWNTYYPLHFARIFVYTCVLMTEGCCILRISADDYNLNIAFSIFHRRFSEGVHLHNGMVYSSSHHLHTVSRTHCRDCQVQETAGVIDSRTTGFFNARSDRNNWAYCTTDHKWNLEIRTTSHWGYQNIIFAE